MKDDYFNQIKIDNGLIVNEKKLKHLKNVEIKTGLDNLSEITVTFYGKVDGLDNLKENNEVYSFKLKEEAEGKSIKG
ncbi:hypothetical protein [Lactococcus lactis]|uniref:hypothetical protein n=1 Tax=Lactococcus lactis TaxID=1358 RepID=UPI0014785A2F|nr:hypothetical protein [Lactococcus lactis]